MESEKTPEQTPVSTTADGTVAPPPVEAMPPAAEAETTDAGKPTSGPTASGTDAGRPAAAKPKEPSNMPVGFIAFGTAVLVVLLVLAFVAYSSK